MKEREKLDELMTEAKNELNIVVENYPDLKANQNFLQLQDSILDVEENLQAARRIYNSNVTYYNNMIVMFPSSIVAKRISAEKKEYFEQTVDAKRDTIELKF
jgi:LemA protein